MKDFTAWDAGLHTKQDEEALQHYGVLGMKWGMHRAAKRGEQYVYQSHATKKYAKKAAKAMRKAEAYDVGSRVAGSHGKKSASDQHAATRDKYAAKAQKYLSRAKRSAQIDRGEQEYAKNLSTGKAIAGAMLFGGNSMKGYAQYRAMAGQKGKNMTGEKVVAGLKAYRAGAYGSRLAKAGYIREGENKKTVGAKAYEVNQKVSNAAAGLINNAAKAGGGFPDRNKKKRK